jgi:NADH:ubiquinone oxidoreductase subunit 2 (subunit N)
MMGLACNSLNGSISSLLFLLMYCFVTLSFFTILLNIENVITKNNMVYLNQLYSILLYNKEIAFHIILIILVMAAIPPFSSFFAKLFILIVSIEAKQEFLTILVLGLTLISTFYYLNFIQQLIFFKYKRNKLFFFNETFTNLILLRINSLVFLGSVLILPALYNIGYQLVCMCALTLTY